MPFRGQSDDAGPAETGRLFGRASACGDAAEADGDQGWHGGAYLGDARNGSQDGQALGEVRIVLDQRFDFRINGILLCLNLLQAGSVVAIAKGRRDAFDPALGRSLILDQRMARRAPIPEIIENSAG